MKTVSSLLDGGRASGGGRARGGPADAARAAALMQLPRDARPDLYSGRWISLRTRAVRQRTPRGTVACHGPSSCAIAPPVSSWWARNGRRREVRARPPPPRSRHLAAPQCYLYARDLRPLYMWWAIGGPNASACSIAGPGMTWLARSGPPRVPLARQTPPPVPSAAPRCASVLPVCARPAPSVHVVGYRWP